MATDLRSNGHAVEARTGRWFRQFAACMSAPYNVAGATAHEPPEAWTWEDHGAQGGQWILKGTDNKGYNCTEYAMAKLFHRVAKWNGPDTQTTEMDEIEQELKNRGFTEPKPPATCGCDEGQLRNCAVLYFAKEDDGRREAIPFHVEVFDPRYCDWAGKMNAGGPIRHRLDPAEFPFEQEARAGTVRLYLCGPNPGAEYYPDDELHRDAINLAESRTMSLPRSLFYLLVGVALGWALYNWLGR